MMYRVFKFYKVCDLVSSKSIDLKKTFLSSYMFCGRTYSDVDFDVNYGEKTFKKFDKLKSYIEKKEAKKLVSIAWYSGRSFIIVENQALNSSAKKDSFCSLDIAFDEEFFNAVDAKSFYLSLHQIFNYDYGYSLSLTQDFDFGTEKRIKKSLFSVSTSVDEDTVFWMTHVPDVHSGYVRDVYPINFINEKHMAQRAIIELKENSVGSFKKLNDSIWIWSLDGNEIGFAKEVLSKSKLIIRK